jgi:Tetracyclin repressor-like, C-terminal domain
VCDTIAEGCRTGEFRVGDVSITTMAILDMLNGIREWFSPAGRLSRAEVIERYTGMVLTMLGAVPAPAVEGLPGHRGPRPG